MNFIRDSFQRFSQHFTSTSHRLFLEVCMLYHTKESQIGICQQIFFEKLYHTKESQIWICLQIFFEKLYHTKESQIWICLQIFFEKLVILLKCRETFEKLLQLNNKCCSSTSIFVPYFENSTKRLSILFKVLQSTFQISFSLF